MEMLQFMGMMMGASLRSKVYLAISLPALFWKQLSRVNPSREDLEVVDHLAVKYLDDISNCVQKGVTPETFPHLFDEHFTTFLSNGEEVELVPGGKTRPLDFQNRHEYCRLVLKTRLAEGQKQVEAIRKGLLSVVPQSVINIFSPAELEVAICGEPVIDLVLLKKNTRYSYDMGRSSKLVRWFWRCLEEYDNYHRVLYLRFVFGRSRLPLCSEDFNEIHEICSKHGGNETLPESHTCFFQIDIPNYTSYNILKEKLTYAIENCQAIDNDFENNDMDVWESASNS